MPDLELAPRDIVARAIHKEIAEGRGAFLDCRESDRRGASRTSFPTVFAAAQSAGIDPGQGTSPGRTGRALSHGRRIDRRQRTDFAGWPLGCRGGRQSTGAHGANRLASNSLLEAVVFAARIAEDIQGLMPTPRSAFWDEMDARTRAAQPAQHVEERDAIAVLRKNPV